MFRRGCLFAALVSSVVTSSAHARTLRVEGSLKPGDGDDTAAIQAAIDSGAKKVIVPRRDAPWTVSPVRGRSDLVLEFEKGAVLQAKKGEFIKRNDCLLLFDCCTNVIVRGYGATLKMRKSDYFKSPYRKSEWRHGLSFLSCRNVKVEGLKIVETGGDGIYLGVSRNKDAGRANVDVVIRDVTCDRNNRQGISVISAENLLIENCDLHRTCGMSPEAGIDFEPNSADQRLVNCRMKNCRMYNNMGSGMEFWLTNLDGSSAPVSILVEDCVTECNHEEIRFRDSPRKFGERISLPRGAVVIRNCTFRNMRGEYIYAAHETDRGIALRMEKCTFVDDPNPPRVRLDGVTECIDDAPGKMKPVRSPMQVGWIAYAFYVDRPRTVNMRVKMSKANPPQTRNGKPAKGPVVRCSFDVLDSKGAKVAEVPLLPFDAMGELDWSMELPAAGIYTFGGFADRGFFVKESDAPVALDATQRGFVFRKPDCDLYAYVPEGTERIVATATGKSNKERLGFTARDPYGCVQGHRSWIESDERYLFRDPAPGWWKFELRKPSVGNFGGCGLDVVGAHGYLFPDKERTWR